MYDCHCKTESRRLHVDHNDSMSSHAQNAGSIDSFAPVIPYSRVEEFECSLTPEIVNWTGIG